MSAQPFSVVALWCWYYGSAFRGYQAQQQGPTVQDTVMRALRAAGFERNPVVAGRTDLGVHARMQVLSMRVVEGVSAEEVAPRLSPHLPKEVGTPISRPVKPKFHAAWSASEKEYRYRLWFGQGAAAPAWDPYALQVSADPARVDEALGRCVGTRNFISFHDSSSAQKPRTVRSAKVHELGGGLFEARLCGDAFGRHMVRYLVGSAVALARGELSQEQYQRALEHAEPLPRKKAPAHPLVLWEVRYPEPVDPFSARDRATAAGVPETAPFKW